MNNSISKDKCPCESGLDYDDCCGVEGRTAVNADVVTSFSAPDGDGKLKNDNITPQIQSAINNITATPDLFPARINFHDAKAWFVKMSPRWYRESVFLDPGRINGTVVLETDLESLAEFCERINWQPTNYIFHTAFCGSTLMSQALQTLYHCLSLREPEVLGNLQFYLKSTAPAQEKKNWLECVQRLLSRRYKKGQAVVVKANDYSNPLICELINGQHNTPVLFMYTPLGEFIAGCLKAENRRAWIAQRYQSIADEAAQKLNNRIGLSLNENAHAEMAAVYWSYNIAMFLEAWRSAPDKTKSLDFNDMLSQPLHAIKACGEFFKLTVDANVDMDSEINRLFGVYSKNSKFKYSPQQRDADIKKVLQQNLQAYEAGEKLARDLLAENYPDTRLPGKLLET